MKKRIVLSLLVLLALFTITGCMTKNENVSNNNSVNEVKKIVIQ